MSMRKILILSVFLTLIFILLSGAMHFLIDENDRLRARYAPSTEEEILQSERMGRIRLSKKEVEELVLLWNEELPQLKSLQGIFIIGSFIGLISIFIVIRKKPFVIKKFDGFFLFFIGILLLSTEWLVDTVSDYFYGGGNALIDLSIGIFVGTLIALPILFLGAYRMNQQEMSIYLHRQKWISYLSMTFAVLILLCALFIGIAVLFTPDLNGNIS